jgi:hypothetical protein
MKNTFTLSVAKPCQEKWDTFIPTAQGGFCASCNKNVIDFTSMSEAEILAFFKHRPAQSCGRFRPDQLRTYSIPTVAPQSSRYWLPAGFLGLSLLLVSKQATASSVTEKKATHVVQAAENTPEQQADKPGRVIKGTVKDEYKEPLPGVSVYLKGSSVGTVTDVNGNFTFPQELQAGDVLIFAFIGYENKQYVIGKDTGSEIEVALVTMCAQLMGEVAIDTPYTAKSTGISKWWQQVKALF